MSELGGLIVDATHRPARPPAVLRRSGTLHPIFASLTLSGDVGRGALLSPARRCVCSCARPQLLSSVTRGGVPGPHRIRGA